MNLNKIRIILLSIVLGLSACQSMQADPSNEFFSGESLADAILKADTTKMIKMLVKGKGCDAVKHINTKVVDYKPNTGQKGHVWGKERWVVAACGKTYPYFVTFTEDGIGGTYFGLQPETR